VSTPVKQRSIIRSLRFSEAEDRAIAKAAAKCGLPFAVYAREALLQLAAPELSQVTEAVAGVAALKRVRQSR
jgi:hypothetical protein